MTNTFFLPKYLLIAMLLAVSPLLGWAQQKRELNAQEVEEYKEQASQMVSFLQYMMNILGSEKATTQEKETIISQSYLKAFRNELVQIEDDLDEDRRVVTNKNVQAYLKDIDFFFKQAKFDLNITDISHYVTSDGHIFFRVTVNRNLQGVTVGNDTVNANQVRYVEINLNEAEKSLKIASIYTTKLSEREELANWWSEVPVVWQSFFLKKIGANGYDSVNYRMLREIVTIEKLALSGRKEVYNLEPLARLNNLRYLDVSGTNIHELVPLRNLTKLETLICSDTKVSDLEALKYSTNLRELVCNNTQISNLRILTNFSRLEKLYCDQTPVYELPVLLALKDLHCSSTSITTLAPVARMTELAFLDCAQTGIADLQPLASATKLSWLSIDGTPVTDLSPLNKSTDLKILICNNTAIQNLDPLQGLPALEKVYCDKTPITQEQANRFMAISPNTLIIFETGQLQTWWDELDNSWQKVFGQYVPMDEPLSKEKLAQVANLTEIDISNNRTVRTLAPLAKLNKLKTLKCAYTNINSLAPLSELIELQYLDCSNTSIDSIGSLTNARNLKTLILDNTQVNSLAPLSSISGIRKLSCEHTNVGDEKIRQFIQEHPECLVIYKSGQLGLWWNELNPVWKELLKTKVAINSDIPSQEQLHEIAFLKELVIEENTDIDDLSPLQELVALKTLVVSNTLVSDLTPISQITTLKSLTCSRNPIRSLDPLSQMVNLTYLDCSNTPIEDLKPLKNSIELEVIKCSGTQIRKLNALSSLINLKQLECYNTNVKKLKPLKGLYEMKELRCYNTRISSGEVDKFKGWHPECKVVYY